MSDEKLKAIPEEYKPISMWGYFGYQILFALPIIGFLFVICFAIGAKNLNIKNFARSYFCTLIIFCILVAILVAVVGIDSFWNALGSLR